LVKPQESLRIEITLPQYYNNGKKVESSKFLVTKKELTDRFGGCTFLKPTLGDWVDDTTGIEYLDEPNSGFQVIVPKSKEAEMLAFFDEYKPLLKKRFRQKDIFIVVQDVALMLD